MRWHAAGGLDSLTRVCNDDVHGCSAASRKVVTDEFPSLQGERLLYKRAKGAFYDTDLNAWLHERGVTHLLVAGVTTEVH